MTYRNNVQLPHLEPRQVWGFYSLLSIYRFVTLFLFFPSFRSLLAFLISLPCPLSFHLPGRSNSESMESRDAAEGIFERELWLQTFHLVLYLAKAGCRVPWLSEDIHSMREGGWDKRKGRGINVMEEKQASKVKKEKKCSFNNIFMILSSLQTWERNKDEWGIDIRGKMGRADKRDSKVEQNDERLDSCGSNISPKCRSFTWKSKPLKVLLFDFWIYITVITGSYFTKNIKMY